MLLCLLVRSSKSPLFTLDTDTVDRITSSKLLGVSITNSLQWDEHINATIAKANKRWHFFKLLKRLSASRDDPLCILNMLF